MPVPLGVIAAQRTVVDPSGSRADRITTVARRRRRLDVHLLVRCRRLPVAGQIRQWTPRHRRHGWWHAQADPERVNHRTFRRTVQSGRRAECSSLVRPVRLVVHVGGIVHRGSTRHSDRVRDDRRWVARPVGVHGADCHWPYSDGNLYEPWGTTVRHTCGPSPVTLTNPHIYNLQSAAGSYEAAFDGAAPFFTSGTNTVGFPTSSHELVQYTGTACPCQHR